MPFPYSFTWYRVFKLCSPTILVNIDVYKPQPHLSQEVANSPKYLHLHSVFQMQKTKKECLDKNSAWLYFIHPCSETHCILISVYLRTKRLKKSEKETSLSNSDSNWTQMKSQFYTESWWPNCTRNCISQSSCWQERHFLHTHKWFAGPPRP